MKLILASRSPRRKELIRLLSLPFRILTIDVNEYVSEYFSFEDYVLDLSKRKAGETYRIFSDYIFDDEVLIAADTIVCIGESVFNKPKSNDEAKLMLKSLQGKVHSVYTGFTLINYEKSYSDFSLTKVCFNPIPDSIILQYINLLKPYDKAGSYGIQDEIISCFVHSIEGCYYNVLGFPVSKIYSALTKNFQ